MNAFARFHLTTLTTLTVLGLISCSIAIWIQWLSGDPAYPKFPPGPVFFIAVVLVVILGSRRWWTPLLGAFISVLTTVGWFVRLPLEILRLTHPAAVGTFPAGIFLGTLAQIIALLMTDIVGTAAAVQNYRRSNVAIDPAKTFCKIFGVPFIVIGLTVAARSMSVDGGSRHRHFWVEANREELPAWIRCFLFDTGSARHVDRRPRSKPGLANRWYASAVERSHLPYGVRHCSSFRGVHFAPETN